MIDKPSHLSERTILGRALIPANSPLLSFSASFNLSIAFCLEI